MSGMLTFGDSIMAGWDGKEYVSQPVPQQIGSLLGIVSVNAAVSSTRIVSGPQNLLEMIKTVDMTGYDLIMLGYGTNDWGYQDETLDDMRMGLDTFKATLKSKNPNAKVFYELPMEQFGWGSKSLDDKNNKGLSQNDVIDFLKQYAEDSGWGYYDWRDDPLITYDNRMTTTGDNGWGHPTPTVMKQMAQRLANAIKPYVSGGNTNDDPLTPNTGDNSILSKMAAYKYIYFGFDPKDEDSSHPYAATPALCGSNDGYQYDLIAEFPQLNGLRDGSMVKHNDTYWITGTLGIYSTTDFTSFKSYDTSCFTKSGYSDVWAPEFFIDMNGDWHLSYCAKASDNAWHTFVDDFDPDTGEVSNTWQKVDSSTGLDPHFIIVGDKYYLFIDGYWLYSSDSYLGPFTEVKTNIQHPGLDWQQTSSGWKTIGNDWYEASATIIDGDKIYLYMDHIDHSIPGVQSSGYMVVQTASTSDLTKWSGPQKVRSSINMRHGSFLLTNQQDDGPTVTHLSLTKMPDDPFKLKGNVSGNVTKTVIAINSIYRFLEKILGTDKTSVKINSTVKNQGLDRILRDFVIRSFDQIKEDVNNAVSVFNKNGFWDIKTQEPIEFLEIKRPQKLALDSDYLITINNNWSAIESKVNELFAIIAQFTHNKKGD